MKLSCWRTDRSKYGEHGRSISPTEVPLRELLANRAMFRAMGWSFRDAVVHEHWEHDQVRNDFVLRGRTLASSVYRSPLDAVS